MKRTFLIYRDGDADTEEHLAVVHAHGYVVDFSVQHPHRFTDPDGRPVLFVPMAREIKVREIGADT